MKTLSYIRSIFRFVKRHNRIFIYGAGHYGMLCHKLLYLNIWNENKPVGFVVSNPKMESFLGLPIYSIGDVNTKLQKNDGILMALNEKNLAEVEPYLSGIDVDALKIPECVFSYLAQKGFLSYAPEMRRFAKYYAPSPYEGANQWDNILVVRIDRMGDLIWTSAFFRELRRNFPEAHITALIAQSYMMLMENCPYVDRVIGCDETNFDYDFANWWKMFWWTEGLAQEFFSGEHYDVVFLPRGLMEQDMLSNLFFAIHSGAKIRISNWFDITDKVGRWFRASMKPLFSVIAEHEQPKHEVSKILDMLRVLGCNIESAHTELWRQEGQKECVTYEAEIQNRKLNNEQIIVLGITGRDAQRLWNPWNYKILIDNLRERHQVFFLLCGDQTASDVAAKIFTDNCMNLVGKTNLLQMIRIMELADMYVGVDTGLMHMAAAVKKPVVEISIHFPWGEGNGISSPLRCGPWQTKSIIVQPTVALDETCASKGYCVDSRPHCINTITVERVQTAVEKMLEEI